MIEKTSSSGLNDEHLKLVFVRHGEDGLRSLFGEDFDGKPRVTKILSSLAEYFNSLK